MIEMLSVGEFQSNCYLYWSSDTKSGVIIDPGAEAGRIEREITRSDIHVEAILLTHGHSDHIGAVREIKQTYDVPIYACRAEREFLINPVANLSAFFGAGVTSPEADHWLEDEQSIMIAGRLFLILHIPGHSPGSICFLDQEEGVCFCGDVLFKGSVGRSDFPGCSHELLISGIEKKLLRLPDSIICYPGHGSRTTIGEERRTNPFLTGGQFA